VTSLAVAGGLLLGPAASGTPLPAPAPAVPAPAVPAPAVPAPVLTVATDQDVLTSTALLVARGAPPPPPPQATGWVVADLDSGAVLAAQNARAQLAPASTLKMLTALALSPPLEDGQVYTASRAVTEVDGSKAGMVEGAEYQVVDLLHALLMSSSNDAAIALGELSGGPEQAVARMNTVAAGLGADDTLAVNTSGLDAAGQVSSARDLVLIGRQVLADDRLAGIVVRPLYPFPGVGTGFEPARPRFQIGNHNKLLGRYDGAIGLKNGYTVAARGSLVSAAERDGRRLVVALVRTEGSASTQTADLLDWAFALPADIEPVTTLEDSVLASQAGPPAPLPAGDDRSGDDRSGEDAAGDEGSGGDPTDGSARPDQVGDGALPLAEPLETTEPVAAVPGRGLLGAGLAVVGVLLASAVLWALSRRRRARG